MRTARAITSSFAAMRRYKLRSFFMMLGVLVGVAALTLVVSIGQAAERKIMENVERMFSAESIFVSSGGSRLTSGPHAGAARLTLEDVEALAAEIPEIETWDPMQMLPGREVRFKGTNATIRVWAYSERSEEVWRRSVSQGDYFDAAAVRSSARVALVGDTVVKELFGDHDVLGAQIQIGSVPFRVIGILEPMGTDLHGMDRDNEIVVPITTAMRRLMNVDTIMAAKLLVQDPERMTATVGEIRDLLRQRHALSEGEPDDFRIITPVAVRQMVSQANRVFSVFLPLIAAVSPLVGGVVAATLMLLSVSQRVSEIGLRRAVGARARDIRLQFLLETTSVTLAGGLAGAFVGTLGVLGVARMMGMPAVISWQAILLGAVLSTVTGIAAGVLPARRAASLLPADALR